MQNELLLYNKRIMPNLTMALDIYVSYFSNFNLTFYSYPA